MNSKFIFFAGVLWITFISGMGQSYDQNFVREQSLKVPVTDPVSIPPFTDNGINEIIRYGDGLSRNSQVVMRRMSPNEQDFIQFSVYDNTGRQPVQYLPYAPGGTEGNYHHDPTTEQADFYFKSPKLMHTAYPFSETRFDNSPSDLITEASFPGEAWKMKPDGSGNTVITTYGFNTANEVRKWHISGDHVETTDFYPANELTKTTMNGENRHLPQGDKQVIGYSDKSGKTILKKEILSSSQALLTYYVYDDFGQLRFIIPAKASALIPASGSWSSASVQTEPTDLIFSYLYDSKHRVIEKKTPGKAEEYFAYDQLDRIKTWQDGNLRENHQWYYYEYDVLGRVVVEGILNNNNDPLPDMQVHLDGLTSLPYEERSDTSEDRYFHQCYPSIGVSGQSPTKYRLYYYDEYPSFLGNNYSFHQNDDFPEPVSSLTKGKLVVSKTRILQSSEKWLMDVLYYDKNGRIIQKVSDNPLGGIDVVFLAYDFDGKLNRCLTEHNYVGPSGYTQHWVQYRYDYDNAGRIINTFQRVDNSEEEINYSNCKYNEAGQLVQKNLHQGPNDPKFLQSVDYAYNTRGWLTFINNANLGNVNEFSQNEITLNQDEAVTGMKIDSVQMHIILSTDGQNHRSLGIGISDKKSLQVSNVNDPNNIRYLNNSETHTTTLSENVREDSLSFARLSPLDGKTFQFPMNGLFFDANSDITEILDSIVRIVNAQLAGVDITDSALKATFTGYIRDYLYKRIGVIYFNRDSEDLFGMNLTYEYCPASPQVQYNGNVSSLTWQVKGNQPMERRYIYTYDQDNRLLDARYKSFIGGSWTNNGEDDRYSISDVTYDENGNILTMKRSGETDYDSQSGPSFGEIDDLNYSYKGNKLAAVSDAENTRGYMPDFHDLAQGPGDDYAYDNNGNLTSDGNKSIKSIVYNFLNLPVEINFGDNFQITYLYDASGRKLSKKVYVKQSLVSQVDYCGEFIYNDNQLQMVMTPEGRLMYSNGTFDCQYFLKDHLGNVRVVFHQDPETRLAKILQEDHFDPFGMTLGGLSQAGDLLNKYLYQGKEYQDDAVDLNDDSRTDTYLNWYDFGARFYDPQIARWHVPDPAGQDASPYVAMGNNPVSIVDPDGCKYIWSMASYWRRISHYHNQDMLGPVNELGLDLAAMAEDGYGTWDFLNNEEAFRMGGDMDYHGDGGNDIANYIWGCTEYANNDARQSCYVKQLLSQVKKLCEKQPVKGPIPSIKNVEEWKIKSMKYSFYIKTTESIFAYVMEKLTEDIYGNPWQERSGYNLNNSDEFLILPSYNSTCSSSLWTSHDLYPNDLRYEFSTDHTKTYVYVGSQKYQVTASYHTHPWSKNPTDAANDLSDRHLSDFPKLGTWRYYIRNYIIYKGVAYQYWPTGYFPPP
jgi:RHS repeat-associated protein